MADPFVGEIRSFPFNFAPTGWARCDGQLLPISQNTALFSLLGTSFGGDGRSTFALPDLQGAAAMGAGHGPGLSLHDLGETGGEESVTLLESEMPVHSHTVQVSNAEATSRTPVAGAALATPPEGDLYATSGGTEQMAPESLAPSGGSLPHNNMQPYLVMQYCIALQGVFPQRP
ncbi:phage tail protein [Nocardioides daphniae]|uniref:Phage tail protein n=1 Tax=Nocardioides daphniae TaxID=402297 RepID=A0A4P7UC52_9ACTN|nr:tail fiber protein [Nocardioides daphniae]QCC76858.1 phage tail protein [Nocardioides daphniae]GGD17128.1 tail Collar domain-containing protein [Nocardioides daphniae]